MAKSRIIQLTLASLLLAGISSMGMAANHPDLNTPAGALTAMRKIQSQSTSNPASVSQAASVAALNGEDAAQGGVVDVVA